MNSIRPVRSFLRNGIFILLFLIVIIEIGSWSINYQIKLDFVNRNGGVLFYIILLVKGILLPEVMSVFILTILMDWFRRGFKIELIDTTWRSVARYELSFLPILLIAFVVFIPFTQSMRYLLTEFPNYSFATYWNTYILNGYSWKFYFQYLFFVLLIGYCTLNLSLLQRVLRSDSSSMV